jgi:threonine dehydratase
LEKYPQFSRESKITAVKIPISHSDIQTARDRISEFIHRTPILHSSAIDEMAGAKVYFKCENFQKIGAFKARGALNTVLSLSDEVARLGVATHSSGNHGQAVAWAAGQRGVKAYVVMPENAPEVKKKAVAGYGAEIILCESTLEGRERALEKVCADTGAHFIHPYNDDRVISGQASCAAEFFEDQDLDALLVPVGGGGLLSGSLLTAYYHDKNIDVYGCEPKMADDAYQSLRAGKIIPQTHPQTIADGLRTSLGDRTFPIIQQLVKDITTCREDEIISAMRVVYERLKIVIEPSCAVPLACLFNGSIPKQYDQIGIIITGGNVDLNKLPFS